MKLLNIYRFASIILILGYFSTFSFAADDSAVTPKQERPNVSDHHPSCFLGFCYSSKKEECVWCSEESDCDCGP